MTPKTINNVVVVVGARPAGSRLFRASDRAGVVRPKWGGGVNGDDYEGRHGICIHFSQLVDHIMKHKHTPHNTTEHTHAKISTSTVEHQVSRGGSDDQVVDR